VTEKTKSQRESSGSDLQGLFLLSTLRAFDHAAGSDARLACLTMPQKRTLASRNVVAGTELFRVMKAVEAEGI
jgi:hypothetical protein